MIINDKRALAWVGEINDIQPIPGYDRVEYAGVLGWHCIVSKEDDFKIGDKVVYFEIDSKVPEGNPAFEFLRKRDFKVKTIKMCGVYSQGLIMPLSKLGLDPNLDINTDLTEALGVTYAISEDNFRKSDRKQDAERSYMRKHPKFFNNRLVKKLMRFKFFRALFLLGMHKGKAAMKKAFPSEFVAKTDEERIQNMPWILEDKTPLVATEKIDGTSTTWLMVRKAFGGFEFYVCSRNVRMYKRDQECFDGNDNIYWENAIKYDVENQLKAYLKKHKELKWICIQGESYGEDWQGNPLKMKGHHFAAFNLKDSKNGRWGSIEARAELASWDTPIPWVPILDTEFVLPDTVEELLKIATAKSQVNPEVLREGIVFRGKDGNLSFKAVSPEYLEKHNL